MKSKKITMDILKFKKYFSKLFKEKAYPIIDLHCETLVTEMLEDHFGSDWSHDVPCEEKIPYADHFNRCSEDAILRLVHSTKEKRYSSFEMARAILHASSGNPVDNALVKSTKDFKKLVKNGEINNGKFKVVFGKIEAWKSKIRDQYSVVAVTEDQPTDVESEMTGSEEETSGTSQIAPGSDQV